MRSLSHHLLLVNYYFYKWDHFTPHRHFQVREDQDPQRQNVRLCFLESEIQVATHLVVILILSQYWDRKLAMI